MALSRNQIKFVKSLHQKKYRDQEGLFIVEGVKLVNELLKSDFVVRELFCADSLKEDYIDSTVISNSDMERISGLKTPPGLLAVVEKKNWLVDKTDGISLILDDIRDPGNLGTILRSADWFGVKRIFCSPDCVDIYNSKVVQASMGSVFRMNVTMSATSDSIINLTHKDIEVFVADMDGASIFEIESWPESLGILIGNESHGINDDILEMEIRRITIPSYGNAESLNAAVATSIILSSLRS